jgi:hypothetical protein
MILDQHGNPVTQEVPVWMDYVEWKMQEQLQLRQLAEMFPTLKGFLWDIKPKTTDNERSITD